MHTLKMKNLSVSIDNKVILKDFNLEINSGEIHAIMGPNGAGKSTLSKAIMGNPDYKIVAGEILYDGININNFKVDERANLGIFLAMQNPLEIEGVTNADFLRSAMHAKEKDNFKLLDFIKKLNQNVLELKMNKDMIHRDINVGFSGGEKKKNEVLQLYMLKPNFIILDEIDSGLDVDSLKLVGEAIMKYYKEYNPAILLITHYKRLLDYIKPTHVHILQDSKIIKSGNSDLANYIEEFGYNFTSKETIKNEQN